MAKQAYRVHNWAEYNKALVHRGSLNVWCSSDVLNHWHFQGQQSRGGQRLYSDLAIETCLLVREVYRLTYRMCQGLMMSFLPNLTVPHYTTLCRRSAALKVNVHRSANSQNGALHVLIDATGIRVYGESEWKRLKHGASKQRCWRKLHLTIDAKEQWILSAKTTDHLVHDMNYFNVLINDIDEDIECIIGDGCYDKRHCYECAYMRGSELLTPPQHNARLQCENRNYQYHEALDKRDKAIAYVRSFGDKSEGLTSWKESTGYHRRSLVEAAMYRLKSQFGDEVTGKSLASQSKQLLMRCNALNKMTALGMPDSRPV